MKKYAVEMGSVAMISIPSFIKIGAGILKLIGGYIDRMVKGKVPVLNELSTTP
jgi:hypothetical protein